MLAVLALSLSAAACGGSGSDDSTEGRPEVTVETGSLSKAAFIKRADAMCKASKAQALREFIAFSSKTGQAAETGAASAEIVHTIIVPIYEKLIERFSALGAPKGDEQDVAGFLNTLQQDLDLVEEKPGKALNGLNSPFKPAAAEAVKYGLTVCAHTLA